MQRPYRHIKVEQQSGVFCVWPRQTKLDDEGLEELSMELARLLDEEGCRKLVLSLGPEEIDCLFSVLLAKLIYLQRRLESAGGTLAVAHASPHVLELFEITGLQKHFRFFPDRRAAVLALTS